jgi:hypothetical protein
VEKNVAIAEGYLADFKATTNSSTGRQAKKAIALAMAYPLPVPMMNSESWLAEFSYFFFLADFFAAFFFVAMCMPPSNVSPLRFYLRPNFYICYPITCMGNLLDTRY